MTVITANICSVLSPRPQPLPAGCRVVDDARKPCTIVIAGHVLKIIIRETRAHWVKKRFYRGVPHVNRTRHSEASAQQVSAGIQSSTLDQMQLTRTAAGQ